MSARVVHCVITTFLFLFAPSVFANIYMGTGVDLPNPNAASSQFAAVPYADTRPEACQPFTGKGPMPPNPCVGGRGKLVAVEANKPMVVTVRTGSLKVNVEKIARQGGWHSLVWRPNYDFQWLGNVTITGRNVQDVMAKLLEPYPLQAVFFEANHVVAVVPRRSA